MNQRGFSIVEILVVLAVITGLLILGLAGFNNYQKNANDEKRKAKAENIARYLEEIYKTGSTNPTVNAGSYPSLAEFATSTKIKELFSKNGFDVRNLEYPENTTAGAVILTPAKNGGYDKRDVNTIDPKPVDDIVYQPLTVENDGTMNLCVLTTQECRNFSLYYKKGDQVQQIMSSRQ